MGSEFTYQCRLTDGGSPADGLYDLQFRLFDSLAAGTQIGSTVNKGDTQVANGLFTVTLDFGGSAFQGEARWLSIGVRPGASTGAFTPLTPRQALTAAPYALSLMPGAVISGTIPSPGEVISVTNSGLGGEGVRVNSRGSGVLVISSSFGVVVQSASDDGVRVESAGEYGIEVNDTGVDGVHVFGVGQDGVDATTSNASAYGGRFANTAAGGTAVLADAGADSGDTEGLVATSVSTIGEGIEALNTSGSAGANIIVGCGVAACTDVEFRVQRNSDVSADGAFTGGGTDYADLMAVAGLLSDYSPGDVLVIGPDGRLLLASQPNATTLAGVYSTRPAFVGDPRPSEEPSEAAAAAEGQGVLAVEEVQRAAEADGLVPVALVGVVPVKVSAENGPIQPGDLLTTSATLAHAMRASPVLLDGVEIYLPGTILGKALEAWSQGTGVIQALISLR